MDKYIQDSKVAVIYQSEYGTGWYTSHNIEELIFDPYVVSLLQKRPNGYEVEIETYLDDKYESEGYWGDICGLEVTFVPKGEKFQISEYDGKEDVLLQRDFEWLTA